ncbi:MAG: class I SAM-dependent methyltransferase [Methanophagales archaeon]|nr:class I SAM-dependent methyltransferase [Methanophagales archaeon]
MNRLVKYIEKHQWKKPETFGRYYINKSYAKWNHNVRGRILEIGGGRIERYTKNSITLDISSIFDPDILASGYNLPFKDNVFDTIVSMEVLEHLEKPQSFVNEIHRVLKPDGTFFLTTRFIHEVHGEDYFRYTKLSLETLFKKFRIVNVEEQGSILSVLSHLIVSSFRSSLLYSISSLFYPLIEKIDKHGPKRITLGYSIYGEK